MLVPWQPTTDRFYSSVSQYEAWSFLSSNKFDREERERSTGVLLWEELELDVAQRGV